MDTLLILLVTIGVFVLFNIFRNNYNEKITNQRIEEKGLYGEQILKHVQGLNFPTDIKCNVKIYKDHMQFTYQSEQTKLEIKKIQSTAIESTKSNYYLHKQIVISYASSEGENKYIILIPNYPTDGSFSSNGASKIMYNNLSKFNKALEERINEINGIADIRVTEL